MTQRTKFHVSKHCQERWIERINGGSNTDERTLFTILNVLNVSKNITNKVFDDVPRYILYLYEKYQTASISIFQKEEVLFITKKRIGTESLYDVLTCYSSHGHLEQFKSSVMPRSEVFIKIKEIKKKLK